jgi:hypothetical protein
MNLQQFVKMLPKHLVYAPIYRKGVEIKSKEGKILQATGQRKTLLNIYLMFQKNYGLALKVDFFQNKHLLVMKSYGIDKV